jgi:hypothetical protein
MSEKYIWAEDPRPVCIIPDGGFTSLKDIGYCKIPQDYVGALITYSQKIYDKNGKELDGDNETKVKERKTEHAHKKNEKKEVKIEKKEMKQEQPKLIATVGVPAQPADVPKPQQKMDTLTSLPLLTGAIAGAITSAVGPMAANFLKTLLKNLIKSNKSNPKEEKKEQPTDCKTSQLNAFARFKKLETKISALEKKEQSADINADRNNLEELIERIEKLEKGESSREKP